MHANAHRFACDYSTDETWLSGARIQYSKYCWEAGGVMFRSLGRRTRLTRWEWDVVTVLK